MTPLTGV